MPILQSLWSIDPWLASPVVFAIGVALLYARWPIARISAVFVVLCGLLLAWTPGDPDNWWMAVILLVLGAALLACFRPGWLRNWRKEENKSRLRFSLRDLLIASCVFGLCLSLVLRAFQYRAEQVAIADLVDPILQDYASSVAFDNGHVRLVSTNNLPRYSDPLYTRARECGFSHWYSSDEQRQPFADRDLARVVSANKRIRFLDLRQSDVTEDGLAVLEKLDLLEVLWLGADLGTPIAIEHLKKLEELNALSVDEATAEQRTLLRDSLPNCEIQP